MGDNTQIIREFIECWSTLDSEKLASYFAEDGCYHNMPLGPVTGRENIRSFIDDFLKTWTETEWEIINIAWTEDIVIVERLDKTKFTKGNVALPCVGVFEMEAGKIKVWRDYFDMATYMNAMKSGCLTMPSTGHWGKRVGTARLPRWPTPVTARIIAGFDCCYFSLNSRGLKSYDMQTISAIIKLNSGVFELERNLQLGILTDIFKI